MMRNVVHRRCIFSSVIVCCLGCGGGQKPPTTDETTVVAPNLTPTVVASDAGESRVLSDASSQQRETLREEEKRKAAFEDTASLAAPTPAGVEVPVLLDYRHAEVMPPDGHRGPVERIVISDDGRLILTASRDDSFKLLTRGGATLLRTFRIDGAKTEATRSASSSCKTNPPLPR